MKTDPLRTRVLEHDLLRIFVAVVDYGGYTAAANVLHRSQAAVSQQIKRLEESAQVALFRHPRREVQLTPQGQTLLEYARRLVALNDEALSSIRSDEVGGKVRIGANNLYATTVLPKLLAQFCKAHPEVQIEMHTGVASEMHKRLGQRYDMVINNYAAGTGGGHLLQRRPVHWVASPTASPHERNPLPLALLPQGSLLRAMAIEALARDGRAWHLAQESSGDPSLDACAAAGLAVGITTMVEPGLRVLTEADGMPRLGEIDVRLELADSYLPRAAVKLHAFLLDALLPGDKVD